MRTFLIRLFTFLGGIYFFLEFVLPGNLNFDRYHEEISDGFNAIGVMAIGLGLINLVMFHGTKIIYRRTGYFHSCALLLGLLCMLLVSFKHSLLNYQLNQQVERLENLKLFAEKIRSDSQDATPLSIPLTTRNSKLLEALNPLTQELSQLAEQRQSVDMRQNLENLALLTQALKDQHLDDITLHDKLILALGELNQSYRDLLQHEYLSSTTKKMYSLLFDGIFTSLGSAMFSLLGFYIASAAYRAFRIRTAESALMTLAAIVVMLGQIPFGMWLWHGLPEARLWLLTVPNSAAFRAIKIGAAVAGLVMAFRMWFSIETKSFAKEQ